MADYVAVLNRAIASVGATTPEARQALYDKARKALIAQLESREPPLTALQLSEQKSLLDRAVRQVEAEQTGRAFTPSAPPRPAAPAQPAPPQASPAKPAPAAETGATPAGQPPKPDAPAVAKPEPSGTSIPQATAHGQETIRSAVSESSQLGHAAASASRGARGMLDETGEEPSESEEIAAIVKQVEDREHARLSATRDTAAPPPFVRGENERGDHFDDDEGLDEPKAKSGGGVRGWISLLVIIAVLAGAGWLGWTQKDAIGGWIAQLTGGNGNGGSSVQVKNEDRLSNQAQQQAEQPAQQSQAQAPSQNAGPPATQAALVEENPDDPSRAQIHAGKVRWTARQEGGETIIDGQIEIPEKRVVLALTIRKNTDQTLPASHVIELLFTVPSDFSGGGISNVPGLLMKATPQAQGSPLAGESVRVTNGYFWIGLSSADVELRRNLSELKQRDYIDIPVVYDNGRRAIMSIAKGPDGDAAFEEAFSAWQE
ncbi:MAG: hypothetical protein H6883_14280 [Rhodobiaceae bacterium]|nr:hypothetical protein [Rhodobiaceae bacterium]